MLNSASVGQFTQNDAKVRLNWKVKQSHKISELRFSEFVKFF